MNWNGGKVNEMEQKIVTREMIERRREARHFGRYAKELLVGFILILIPLLVNNLIFTIVYILLSPICLFLYIMLMLRQVDGVFDQVFEM